MSNQNMITGDGSSSLYSKKYDETYHSRHGAVQESLHVFLAMGLEVLPMEQKEVAILEMGFGTGLNAFLTCLHKGERTIHFTSLEAEPVSESQIADLNYVEYVSDKDSQAIWEGLHSCPWEEWVEVNASFFLKKLQVKLQDFYAEEAFDLIYFDAFAPDTQPELWTEEIFARLFSAAKPGAIMVTYSSKGAVRRAMIHAGFDVEKVPGPPGKREMLRARKTRKTETIS